MVYAYDANIHKLDSLQKGIEKVAKIHVATHVLSEHYGCVSEALLTAIKEILSENATDEVIDVLEEAYGFLSQVFIGKEKELYA